MKICANPDAELSPSQLKELSQRLMSKRRDLVDSLAALKEQITLKDDCSLSDAAEAAALQERRAQAKGIANQNQDIITEIELALKRLENGHYGVSEADGEPIPYARLLLVPWARSGVSDGNRVRRDNA